MVEKLQRFLKNKHKFDHKIDIKDLLEIFDNKYNAFRASVKSDDKEAIKTNLIPLLIEILKYLNTKDIGLDELLEKQMN